MKWSAHVASVVAHAESYAKVGRSVVAIPFRSKGPKLGGWQRFTPQEGLQSVYDAANRGEQLNLGLVQGHGTAALDFDKKDGKDGEAGFRAWVKAHGDHDLSFLDGCSRARTPTGGDHYVMRMPADGQPVPSPQNALGIPGFDVRATGAQIVIAPSWHPEVDVQYAWYPGRAPWEVAETWPEVPQWLADELRLRHGKGKGPQSEARRREARPGDTPTRDEFEEKIAGFARQRKKVTDARKAKQILALFEGKPIAEDGGGHDALLGVTGLIARTWPLADKILVMEFIRPGIEARIALGRKTSFHDIERMLGTAQEKYAAEIVARESGWRGRLKRDEEGKALSTEGNLLTTLEHHDDWKEVFRINERSAAVELLKALPLSITRHIDAPFDVKNDSVYVQRWLQEREDLVASNMAVRNALATFMTTNSVPRYDPFADWLQSLPPWDGKPRAATWLVHYLGVADTPLARIYGLRWPMQLVARTLPRNFKDRCGNGPGAKCDATLVVQGDQGLGKTTALEMLMPPDMRDELFTSGLPELGNKESLIHLAGPAIIELGEMRAVRKADVERVKEFLTTRVDRFRVPYETVSSLHPRRCIFAATTNLKDFLRDETGNRRFWVVEATRILLDELDRDRDQLWAEIFQRYLAGERWWLEGPAENTLANTANLEWLDAPIWADQLFQLLDEERDQHRAQVGNFSTYGMKRPGPYLFISGADALSLVGIDASRARQHRNDLSVAMVSRGWREEKLRPTQKSNRTVWIRPGITSQEALAALREDVSRDLVAAESRRIANNLKQ